MSTSRGLLARVLSALLVAVSVVLLTAGLFSFTTAPPEVDGRESPAATSAAGDPVLPTGADSDEAGSSPSMSPASSESPVASLAPGASPPASPAGSPSVASPSASPDAASSPPSPDAASPSPSPLRSPEAGEAVASRIVIPSLDVDLAIMSGDADVPGNRDSYPLCDVAQYLTYYNQPGEPGTTYIYAHAQRGMFLPMLRASQRSDGAEMIGAIVQVYTADGRLHLYEIFRVKRHARDLTLADSVAPGEQRLVLQTSEGTRGHIPKLQVAARPIGVLPATLEEANPEPRPRPCWR